MKTPKRVKDERGMAFPMAMIIMAILTALMMVFSVLATHEPQVASNQMASAQARALAESGVERALWALTTGESSPTANGVLLLDAGYNLPVPMTSPYDGSAPVAVNDPVLGSQIGVFRVTVADRTAADCPTPCPNEKVVTAIGYVPDAANPVAIKKIKAVVTRLKWINPLCGLCAGGENPPLTTTAVQVGGTAEVNASATSQSAAGGAMAAGAYCPGVAPIAAVASNGTVDVNGTPNVYGPPAPGTTYQAGASFPPMMFLRDQDMATLRALAKAAGPGHYFSGSQNFSSPPANGLIFVDTPSGNPLTNNSPSSDLISVHLTGNWNTTWQGWFIVAGSLRTDGQIRMNGLIYAQNDVILHGTGNGAIQGAVVSTNRVDTAYTTIGRPTLDDSEDIGNAPISYNCPMVRNGGGNLSQNWFVKPGSYQEISGT